MASKGSNGREEQANEAVEGMTRTLMSCLATRYDVEVPTGHPVAQFCDPTRSLAVGTFSTRRRWLERVLQTVPEELLHCRDRMARSKTSHVETSIQVEIRSVGWGDQWRATAT